MNVILGSTDDKRRRLSITSDSAEVGMQLGLDRGRNEIATFLCGEHDVHQEPCERLRHRRILPANPLDG